MSAARAADDHHDLYTYVRNDPTDEDDPTGQCPRLDCGGGDDIGIEGVNLNDFDDDGTVSYAHNIGSIGDHSGGDHSGGTTGAQPQVGATNGDMQVAATPTQAGNTPEIPSPPNSVPGGPYTPAGSGQQPGTYYGPKQPSGPRGILRWVPPESEGGPPGSQGYWKSQAPGQQGWSRFDQSGNPINPEQAHPSPPPAPPRIVVPEGPFIIVPITPYMEQLIAPCTQNCQANLDVVPNGNKPWRSLSKQQRTAIKLAENRQHQNAAESESKKSDALSILYGGD